MTQHLDNRAVLGHGSVATLEVADREHRSVPEVKRRWSPAWRQRAVTAALVLSDSLLALLTWVVAYALQGVWGRGEPTELAVAAIFPNIVLWVGLRLLLGLYPGYGLDEAERLRRHTYSVFATLATLAIFAIAFQVGDLFSRLLLVLGFMGLLFLSPPAQYLTRVATEKLGLWGRPTIVLGYGGTGERFLDLLEQNRTLGYDPVALFSYRLTPTGERLDARYEDPLTDAKRLAEKQGIDTVIFAMPHTRREQLAQLVQEASVSFRHVLIQPNLEGITNSAVTARDFAGTFTVEIKHNLLDPWAQRAKRALDLFGAVVGGLLISPLLVALAILVRLDSPGPIFYGHRGLGAGDRHFFFLKFRTMHADAKRLLKKYLQGNPYLQAEWEQNHKLRNDPRVTRVGRLLRKTSLDELPQLWNVLRGEMSLTGPRPIVDAEVPKYEESYELYKRIKPGMSGLWQVGGRSDTDYGERVAMDAYYVRNWSVWLDLVILARTCKTVVFGRGAY